METTTPTQRHTGTLEVDGLSIRLGGRTVLDDVSFSVPPGRVVGLLGPNGAGKTTAMRLMVGIVSPDAGEVRWSGRPARRADWETWGYMPQERGLYPKMRVRDQLEYLGRLRGLGRDQVASRTDELLSLLDLSDRDQTKIEHLSGGLQQRVQLAATLVHRPDVLILDEPFSGLDPVAVTQLSTVITEQAHEGRTVVFSSHQLDLVEDLCETIVLLDQGRAVLAGELYQLRAASPRRTLRIGIDAPDPGWTRDLDGASVIHSDANEALLRLEPGTDPLELLDRARKAGTVHDFGLEQPRLSELFLEAVGR